MEQKMQKMLEHLLNQTDAERVGTVRNTYLAGSALSVGILIALTQVGTKDVSLRIAVIGCALAAPIWLALAAVLELYLHMGEMSFAHLKMLRASKPYAGLQFLAGAGLYVALCGVVYFLFPWALIVFIASSVLSFATLVGSQIRLAKWWTNK